MEFAIILRESVRHQVEDVGDGGHGAEGDQDEAEDEESRLLARLFGRLGDAEGVDEGVGEEVEQAHGRIMRVTAQALHPFSGVRI